MSGIATGDLASDLFTDELTGKEKQKELKKQQMLEFDNAPMWANSGQRQVIQSNGQQNIRAFNQAQVIINVFPGGQNATNQVQGQRQQAKGAGVFGNEFWRWGCWRGQE